MISAEEDDEEEEEEEEEDEKAAGWVEEGTGGKGGRHWAPFGKPQEWIELESLAPGDAVAKNAIKGINKLRKTYIRIINKLQKAHEIIITIIWI